MHMHHRMAVVSNRLPFTLRRRGPRWVAEPSTGGVVNALELVLRRQSGVWIGWPGSPADDDTRRADVLRQACAERSCAPVELTTEELAGYYYGFSNRALWPLFHTFPSRLEVSDSDWSVYQSVNGKFRDAVLANLDPHDVVWIHDYQLMLLPELVRAGAPNAKLGFFLHTSFPPAEAFRALPQRDPLLRGLLGADVIAFQTGSDRRHFREAVANILGIPTGTDHVETERDIVRLQVAPIGISPVEFGGSLGDPTVRRHMQDLREQFAGSRLLLAVDRLDYTKGIPQRLRAFRRLLEDDDTLRRKVTLVQIAVPSRDRIPGYARLSQQVYELVGEINGAFGTPGWTPVSYIRRPVPRAELLALYAVADVGWVSPLRDGMNLVAKEYVDCQAEGNGVLVLSEFAGAAERMREALIVNPYDEAGMARTVARALAIDEGERGMRMRALRAHVSSDTASAWSERMIADIASTPLHRSAPVAPPCPLPVDRMLTDMRNARRRLILLDYDGTLVPFSDFPGDAAPPADLLRLLARLVARPGNTVAVVSGRPRRELEEWLGRVPGLWLAAEHGAFLRSPETRRWEGREDSQIAEWKPRARAVLDGAAQRAPTSFLEEKACSVVWHYRLSAPSHARRAAESVLADLRELARDPSLRVVWGRDSIEVRASCVRKDGVAARLLELRGEADIMVAIGDDATDEDLFERLPRRAWTIRVGGGRSLARFRVDRPSDVVALLRRCADAGVSAGGGNAVAGCGAGREAR